MTKASLRSLGTGFGFLALVFAATSIHAQDNTVGNPQLKDFELPGTRTTPPAPPQTNEPQTPPPGETAPPPAAETPAAETPAPPPRVAEQPTAERPAPARDRNVRREPTAERERDADLADELPAGVPAPTELEQALPTAQPAVPAPTPRTEWTPPVPLEQPGQSFPWLYAALGALALLAAIAFVVMRKRKGTARIEEEVAAPEPEAPRPAEPDPLFARRPAPAPAQPAAPGAAAPAVRKPAAPLPSAVAQEGGLVGISLRPRLELEFKPDRAAATLTETSVQFELTIRNVGNRTARDIRIQARMFNAGADQDRLIGEFFAEAAPAGLPPSIAAIQPRREAQFKSTVTLPKEQVREVTIQGRRLFIPMVAFNVLYEWEGGRTGQTSMSYLVGREAPSPQEKMGAFRLDLGPRLYRSIGQRQTSLAKVV